jgi:CheY-like chemotaxis protein
MPKAHILIVEDELIVAEDMKMTLTNLGYTVIAIANTGELAIEIAESKKPDLILMDIMLAGKIDGITTAELIRARQDIPVIYVTAFADETLLQRAKLTTPFGYVVKPFNEREVYSNIEIALFRHQMEKEIKKRDAILFALGAGVEWFLRQFAEGQRVVQTGAGHKGPEDFTSILEHLGDAMCLDRVAVFRLGKAGSGATVVSMTGEWLAIQTPPLHGNPAVQALDIGTIGLTTGFKDLAKGMPVTIRITDFAAREQEMFRKYNVSSVAVLPVLIEDALWGLLFFVDRGERTWSDEELEAMRIAANIVGGAIGLRKAVE